MSILDNPVARREWTRFKRRWPLWVGMILAMVLLSRLWAFGFTHWIVMGIGRGGIGLMWALQFAYALLPRLSDLFLVFWVADSLERERQGAWEHLAVTRLTAREIALGKIAVPLLSILAYLVCMHAHSHFCRYGTALRGELGGVSLSMVETMAIPLVFLLSVLGGVVHAVMAGLLTYRLCRPRTFGHGVLLSVGLLILIGLGVQVVVSMPVGLMTLALLGSVGGAFSPQLFGLALTMLGLLLTLAIELTLAGRFLTKIERETASAADAR